MRIGKGFGFKLVICNEIRIEGAKGFLITNVYNISFFLLFSCENCTPICSAHFPIKEIWFINFVFQFSMLHLLPSSLLYKI